MPIPGSLTTNGLMPGADQGQCDRLGGRCGVLQGQQRHRERGQRGERPPQHQVSGEAGHSVA